MWASMDYPTVVCYTTSVITGTYCDPPRSHRINFYGNFDIPLGRYLKNVLFDQTQFCPSCKEPTESHIRSYIYKQWKLAFSVRRIPSLNLEGKEDGKIWTWRRCWICEKILGIPLATQGTVMAGADKRLLECEPIHGIPQATRRTVMSDADKRLSFGKFLMREYSGRPTPCCGLRNYLRYYGFGDMVIILEHSYFAGMFSVCLPSSSLDFNASAASLLSDAAAVYDNEPPGAISYALKSKDYKDQIQHRLPIFDVFDTSLLFDTDEAASDDEPEESDSITSDHVTIAFEDDSPDVIGKVKKKFSVTCYFAGQFDALRKRYGVGERHFVRSLSSCSAMRGKTNNAYFAKSFDERLIIKQVSKTEVETFVEFASEYFRYLMMSFRTEIPSCLTRILGVYQVTTTHLNEEDDNKKKSTMELMVMENIFFQRKISRIYSFKESVRCHDIAKITDANEVLLDMNVSEEVRSIFLFIENKGKRTLERAVWNDTSFLHSVEVTDYFLLVGVDEKRDELVFGIFEFFTKYNSDMHIETWMLFSKHYSSCILGSGQENDDSPIIVSPKSLKRSLRKLVSRSFFRL